ncbi:hypothetical protein NPIL_692091 [Nephila pilipes]|uniref:Uncharacterized protein n=1 Tax=Nephila pilipes TaxID=299642 RepID=A0A8X6NY01_NEPPI|nr:hypothetical protein NPIL_692091 [Nephila pilipes]
MKYVCTICSFQGIQQPETVDKLLFEQQRLIIAQRSKQSASFNTHRGFGKSHSHDAKIINLFTKRAKCSHRHQKKDSAQEVRTCWTRGFHCRPSRSLPQINLQPPSAEELSEDPGDSSIISQ